MDFNWASFISSALATVSLVGVGVGIGSVLGSLLLGFSRNSNANQQLFIYAVLGFAALESICFFLCILGFFYYYLPFNFIIDFFGCKNLDITFDYINLINFSSINFDDTNFFCIIFAFMIAFIWFRDSTLINIRSLAVLLILVFLLFINLIPSDVLMKCDFCDVCNLNLTYEVLMLGFFIFISLIYLLIPHREVIYVISSWILPPMFYLFWVLFYFKILSVGIFSICSLYKILNFLFLLSIIIFCIIKCFNPSFYHKFLLFNLVLIFILFLCSHYFGFELIFFSTTTTIGKNFIHFSQVYFNVIVHLKQELFVFFLTVFCLKVFNFMLKRFNFIKVILLKVSKNDLYKKLDFYLMFVILFVQSNYFLVEFFIRMYISFHMSIFLGEGSCWAMPNVVSRHVGDENYNSALVSKDFYSRQDRIFDMRSAFQEIYSDYELAGGNLVDDDLSLKLSVWIQNADPNRLLNFWSLYMFYARALAEAELGAQSKSSIRDAQIGVGNITSEDFASMSLLVRTRPQLFCAGEVDKYITCYPGGIGEILKRVEHVEYYLPKKPVTDSKGSVPVLDIYVNNIPMVIPGSVSTFELVESNSIEYSNIQASSELNVDGKNSSTSLRDGFKDLCSVISKSAFSFSKFMFSVLRAPNLYHYSNDVIWAASISFFVGIGFNYLSNVDLNLNIFNTWLRSFEPCSWTNRPERWSLYRFLVNNTELKLNGGMLNLTPGTFISEPYDRKCPDHWALQNPVSTALGFNNLSDYELSLRLGNVYSLYLYSDNWRDCISPNTLKPLTSLSFARSVFLGYFNPTGDSGSLSGTVNHKISDLEVARMFFDRLIKLTNNFKNPIIPNLFSAFAREGESLSGLQDNKIRWVPTYKPIHSDVVISLLPKREPQAEVISANFGCISNNIDIMTKLYDFNTEIIDKLISKKSLSFIDPSLCNNETEVSLMSLFNCNRFSNFGGFDIVFDQDLLVEKIKDIVKVRQIIMNQNPIFKITGLDSDYSEFVLRSNLHFFNFISLFNEEQGDNPFSSLSNLSNMYLYSSPKIGPCSMDPVEPVLRQTLYVPNLNSARSNDKDTILATRLVLRVMLQKYYDGSILENRTNPFIIGLSADSIWINTVTGLRDVVVYSHARRIFWELVNLGNVIDQQRDGFFSNNFKWMPVNTKLLGDLQLANNVLSDQFDLLRYNNVFKLKHIDAYLRGVGRWIYNIDGWDIKKSIINGHPCFKLNDVDYGKLPNSLRYNILLQFPQHYIEETLPAVKELVAQAMLCKTFLSLENGVDFDDIVEDLPGPCRIDKSLIPDPAVNREKFKRVIFLILNLTSRIELESDTQLTSYRDRYDSFRLSYTFEDFHIKASYDIENLTSTELFVYKLCLLAMNCNVHNPNLGDRGFVSSRLDP